MPKQPAHILQRIRHALQEMRFALIESTKAISTQGLHDAQIDIRVVMAHERVAIKRGEIGETHEVEIEKLRTQLRRKIGFGVEQGGGDIILQRALAAALIVHDKLRAGARHNVSLLEITIEKVIEVGSEQ